MRDIPRQKFTNPVHRILGNYIMDAMQQGFRINAVEIGCVNQATDDVPALAAAVGTGKQVITSAKDDPTQCALGCVVVYF